MPGSGSEPFSHLSWSRRFSASTRLKPVSRLHGSKIVPVLTHVGPEQDRRARDLPFQCLHQLPCRIEVSDPAGFIKRRRDLVGQAPVVAGLDLTANLCDPFPIFEDEKIRHGPSRPMGAALQKALIWHVVASRQ